MRVLLRTLPYMKGYRGAALMVLVVLLLEVALKLVTPWAMKVLVDNVLGRPAAE